MSLTIIIPSLNPDEKLLQVVSSLTENGYNDIILVNDGSDEQHLQPFRDAEKNYGCKVLNHEVNKGKGRALKTAFSYYIDSNSETDGVITVDGDNQHSVHDIMLCEKAMEEKPDNIILGCRDFNQPNVPPKSKIGNKMTSFVFKTLCGLDISDTQTGLRAIPKQYLPDFLEIYGERFEYETNMLLEMKQKDIPFTEVKIDTIYIEENSGTHFHPIRDSFKIYTVILKFFISSIISSLIDLGGFSLLSAFVFKSNIKLNIFVSTVGARIISSLFNYFMNKNAVFRHKGSVGKTMLRYYILCVVQMFVSFGLVFVLSKVFRAEGLWKTLIKAVVDTCIFFMSFRIQQNWVFKKNQNKLKG